jgi:Flp pilus assembly protein TadD
MRKIIIAITACIVVLLLGFTGYRGYKVWKQSHWLTMARGYAAKADVRNELLSLQQVLRFNPRNLEACRMMASLADATHSPGALLWRERVVELDSTSLADRLALAQTAISLNNFQVASNALADVDPAGQKTAEYHNVAGVLATGVGNQAEAQKEFAEAARLDSGNPVYQMNLAVMQLHGSNQLDLAEARINLKRLTLNSTNNAVRQEATRELVFDALRHQDFKTATSLAHELVGSTNAVFPDHLLRLEVARQSQSPDYKTTLAACEREAANDPARISQMAGWLMKNTTTADTLGWLKSLPAATQTNQPAAMLAATCQVVLLNWHGLQADIQNQNWGDLEFLRHAYLAKALRGQSLKEAAAGEWGVALNYANDRTKTGQKGILLMLYGLASKWGWNSEAEQILWNLVNQYPDVKWAVPVLTRELMTEGRTRPLMQLFVLQSKRNPNDVESKNNLAFTALLLDAPEMNPNELARQVYDENSQNPSYASTYALSLYKQGKYAEALQVLQKLTPKELEDPAVAGYYGLALKATGHADKAKAYLNQGLKASLLPEERSLFERALIN